MKKKLLAYAVPLLLATSSMSVAAPIELFTQDYETITEALLDKSYGFIVKEIDTAIEADATSENIANFQATTSILLQDDETNITSTENGEVVFTNYAEGKGAATIISKADLIIANSDEEVFVLKDIAQQTQIDRENLQYKFTQQYPEILLESDSSDMGYFHIAGAEGKGLFTFTDNFKVIDNFDAAYQIGKITLKNEAKGLRSFVVNDSTINSVIKPSDLYQKTEVIFNGIALEVMPEAVTRSGFSHLNIAQFTYDSGVEKVADGAGIFTHFVVKDLKLQPAISDTEVALGDFKLGFNIAPVTKEILSQDFLALSNEYILNADQMNPYAYLQKVFVDGSSVKITLDGKLADFGSQNALNITPSSKLIDQLAKVDFINNPDEVDEMFAGLTFFEFVNQYIDAIDLELSVDQNYVIELGSNILIASGKHVNVDSARKEMRELYQQFQLMATLINAETPLVEFVGGKARIHVQYQDGTWLVNDQVVDLEAIAALFG
ncbi:hypothetical protein DC083_00855 [Ignatzschineria ureiclastica]|uniref:DUF945 domain-containing protein n=1 Tax=Ignatzschineria ureiclastica TaxID=472582 RepID=A0A2U2AGI6_9GAMM|nr:hypothetical protein [Ignatzschineria ureiclastica]PWD81776.1 hypothetical protein DC083_00855 [Ignatzschineria ureiclastica]GGZ90453.1 hypothetical protein GCM10007162_01650 [Ignatzschineria ureiclastica]